MKTKLSTEEKDLLKELKSKQTESQTEARYLIGMVIMSALTALALEFLASI